MTNNLYTKVIFCGKGSNQTLTHIINQSSLIDTYCSVHTNIEKNFTVTPNSTRHAPTNMANTLQELCKKIRSYHCHSLVPGSHVEAEVPDILNDGLAEYYQVNSEEVDLEKGDTELGALEMDDLEAM
ncbi:uncharacterized protein EI90DRAFT_2947721 [Cantharellus anzutake]|uniref:uncharacterized protein n=1 Tax=Cantharellus anzutake TaxID=1750568 RepID=UPI001905E6F6|nr:uncharacterized protein EI90DRAFT_2947721 [Cantharellus anzutake]KAF8314839.1 hypothetical protein EI90DRAFT_2947721 [Cantharellus anzutake]